MLFKKNLVIVVNFLLLFCETLSFESYYHNSVGSSGHRTVGILFDSKAPDGLTQIQLVKGAQMAFRDLSESINGPTNRALFVDLDKIDVKTGIGWMIGNNTQTIVSFLEPNQLQQFTSIFETLRESESNQVISIFTPKILPAKYNKNKFTIKSLQMNTSAKISAINHRFLKVGLEKVIPILDKSYESVNQHHLLQNYQRISSIMNPKLIYESPVFLTDESNWSEIQKEIELHNINNNSTNRTGILLLSPSKTQAKFLKSNLNDSRHYYKWFSHISVHDEQEECNAPFGLYSVQYVGSESWDNPERRRLLHEFSSFTGSSPSILSVVLAYDAVWLGLSSSHVLSHGLSGKLSFDSKGYRTDGVYFGLSSLSLRESPSVTLVQPSNWILEDLIKIKSVQNTKETELYSFSDYQLATSSLLTKEQLLEVGAKGQEKIAEPCTKLELEIMTHDPFTQLSYTLNYSDAQTLPQHLLLPNQYGYGLTFICTTKTGLSSTLQIACVPSAQRSIGEPVHCFQSKLRLREKRSLSTSATYPNVRNQQPMYRYNYAHASPRDGSSFGSSGSSYYAPPTMNSYYSHGGHGGYDSSTPGTMTTRLDVPINEEPSSTAAPPPPGTSKLPELRQILKAAKPFVGSCVGSSTGCAICVLVLGRLPLGAVPAACTGPCFVGTFGTCGSLLGRVFSETTVICTELFRQGKLDVDTFIADSEFGRGLMSQSPETLQGYQLLASPLVDKMRESEILTNWIAQLALPWAEHMKYLMGVRQSPHPTGYWIHTLGLPLCGLAGHIYRLWTIILINFYGSKTTTTTLVLSLSILLIITIMIRYFRRRRKSLEKLTTMEKKIIQ